MFHSAVKTGKYVLSRNNTYLCVYREKTCTPGQLHILTRSTFQCVSSGLWWNRSPDLCVTEILSFQILHMHWTLYPQVTQTQSSYILRTLSRPSYSNCFYSQVRFFSMLLLSIECLSDLINHCKTMLSDYYFFDVVSINLVNFDHTFAEHVTKTLDVVISVINNSDIYAL